MSSVDPQLLKLAAKVQTGARTILINENPFQVHTVYLDGRRVVRENVRVFAEDDCGNWIGRRNSSPEVVFVDHETNGITVLANDIDDLVERLVEWKASDLKSGQVISAWIDPELAKRVHRDDA